MSLQALSAKRAPNNTTPLSFKIRVSDAQYRKLYQAALAQGTSIAAVIRALVDRMAS